MREVDEIAVMSVFFSEPSLSLPFLEDPPLLLCCWPELPAEPN
jgi:hypothetical protein